MTLRKGYINKAYLSSDYLLNDDNYPSESRLGEAGAKHVS